MYFIIQEHGGSFFYMCCPEGHYKYLLTSSVGKRLICIAESFKLADTILNALNRKVRDELCTT